MGVVIASILVLALLHQLDSGVQDRSHPTMVGGGGNFGDFLREGATLEKMATIGAGIFGAISCTKFQVIMSLKAATVVRTS